jgi:hypothetical protein
VRGSFLVENTHTSAFLHYLPLSLYPQVKLGESRLEQEKYTLMKLCVRKEGINFESGRGQN